MPAGISELPYRDRLRVDQAKIVDYLLSVTNGRGKAAFFLDLGFRIESWPVMADALMQHARTHPVAATVASRWGTRYSVDGVLEAPSGRSVHVRAVWIVEPGSEQPRLITAHPV
jgi:hypothetical protein